MDENPGTLSVSKLLEQVHEGHYVIPYFQRGFEWDPGLVCDLLESILQGYFTGLILLWNLDKEQVKNEKWDPVWGAELGDSIEIAILDGQQRLSSLYYAIYNPKKRFPNRYSYYLFFMNLTKILNDEYDDVIEYRFYGKHQNWEQLKDHKAKWLEMGLIPICILNVGDPKKLGQKYINSQEFSDWLNEYIEYNRSLLPMDITTIKAYQVINRILNYNFVIFPLGSDRKIIDICNIFARVNAKGMKLSTFDLMNAFLYPKGVRLRKELWENLDNEVLKNIDRNMNEYLLKIISLVKQNYCSSKYIFYLIPNEVIVRKDEKGEKYREILIKDGEEFKTFWKNACKYAEKARQIIMNISEKDFGSIKVDFIPNTTIVPVLAAVLWEFKGDIDDIVFRKKLKKWYWSAVFSEDYSGSSDTVMARDYKDMRAWVNDGSNHIDRIYKINNDYIEEIDFKTVIKGSARYNAIISLLALNKAEDFFKGWTAGAVDFSKDSINDHHIFPKNVKGLNPENSKMFKNAKDNIVNRTLLLDETNIKISNKKPSQYINELIGKYGDEEKVKIILNTHFINDNAYIFLKEDNFDDFIKEREKEIKKHIVSIISS